MADKKIMDLDAINNAIPGLAEAADTQRRKADAAREFAGASAVDEPTPESVDLNVLGIHGVSDVELGDAIARFMRAWKGPGPNNIATLLRTVLDADPRRNTVIVSEREGKFLVISQHGEAQCLRILEAAIGAHRSRN